MTDSSQIHAYPFHDNFPIRAGILVTAELGLLSLVSVCWLLVVTSTRTYKLYNEHRQRDSDEAFLEPVSIFFIGAVIMDGIQAIGSALNVKWAFKGAVQNGSYCTTQGVFEQFGNSGAALFTIAISVTTYIKVVRKTPINSHRSNRIAFATIGIFVLFLFLIILVPAVSLPKYYRNTGLWCWVNGNSGITQRLRIASEYALFWIASLTSIILYGMIVRRFLREAKSDRSRTKAAIVMGWYPIAYTVEILPISIIRLIQFHDANAVSHGYAVLGNIFFVSSGLVNVILWSRTGRQFGFSKQALAQAREMRENGRRNANVTDAPTVVGAQNDWLHARKPTDTPSAQSGDIYEPGAPPFDPYTTDQQAYNHPYQVHEHTQRNDLDTIYHVDGGRQV